MYRSVTLFALREHLFDAEDTLDADRLSALLPQVRIDFRLNPETGHADACLNGENVEQKIRGLEVSSRVSIVRYRHRRLPERRTQDLRHRIS